MKTKEQIKSALTEVAEILISVKLGIVEINKSDQFDYVSDSKLGSLSDDVLRLASQISKLVNQE